MKLSARMGNLEYGKIDLEKAQEVLKDSEDKYAVACMWYVTGLLEGARQGEFLGVIAVHCAH